MTVRTNSKRIFKTNVERIKQGTIQSLTPVSKTQNFESLPGRGSLEDLKCEITEEEMLTFINSNFTIKKSTKQKELNIANE